MHKPINTASTALPIGLAYHDNKLCFDGQSLAELAQKFSTPLYIYSENILQNNAHAWWQAMRNNFGEYGEVAYAVKANDRIGILRSLAHSKHGNIPCSADVVSEGELLRALAAEIPPQKIIFSGCGKSNSEMKNALAKGVTHFNVEAEDELMRLNSIAKSIGAIANVSLRIVPNINADTHNKISTGRKKDKFGIEPAVARKLYLQKLEAIQFDGVAVHIGSQITKIKPFQDCFRVIAEWCEFLKNNGVQLKRIDLGGGLGIDERGQTTPTPEIYAQNAQKYLKLQNKKIRVLVEPGRSIAASAGLLLCRAITTKSIDDKICVVIDIGMNDFLRTALYDATHRIIPITKNNKKQNETKFTQNIWAVGPVCESSDTFGIQKELTETKNGDLLALTCAGAYGAVMTSSYNARPTPAEIIISKISEENSQSNSIQLLRNRGSIANEIKAENKAATKIHKF